MAMIELRVWTKVYTPFRLTSSTTEMAAFLPVNTDTAVNLGRGFFLFEVVSPTGAKRYVEPISGGIVASPDDIENVKEDVWKADVAVLNEQLIEQRIAGLEIKTVSPEAFWKALRLT